MAGGRSEVKSTSEGKSFERVGLVVTVSLEAIFLDFHVVDAVYERESKPGLEFWNRPGW